MVSFLLVMSAKRLYVSSGSWAPEGSSEETFRVLDPEVQKTYPNLNLKQKYCQYKIWIYNFNA